MARTAQMARTAVRSGSGAPGRRHPLVATAMVLPLALVLAVMIGGVDAVVAQASSVAGMLGR
jgi:hypothetical protein